MGNLVSGNSNSTSNMEENFKKNQEFITSISKIKMERHLQMLQQMREREVALDMAREREKTNWLLAFSVAATVGLLTGFRRTKRAYVVAPLLPLAFWVAYQVDYAYGNKMQRIIQEAENIMQFEGELLEPPCGVPTASAIDQARLDAEEGRKLHPLL